MVQTICDNTIPTATAAFNDSAFPFPGIVIFSFANCYYFFMNTF